jgi:hypothetical protein
VCVRGSLQGIVANTRFVEERDTIMRELHCAQRAAHEAKATSDERALRLLREHEARAPTTAAASATANEAPVAVAAPAAGAASNHLLTFSKSPSQRRQRRGKPREDG